ncbi:unnamed protein product [Cyprideis torosa]|uniref:Uncharacterized protein n=1 Tax=Cyprideis torosa TaxID=163714 RepID=A0A7R8WF01_9CRUS|nr:unnamed protein product [Cyprideis torosa]CAG0896385.1 unnamed protein product [Cyprideis torosa]
MTLASLNLTRMVAGDVGDRILMKNIQVSLEGGDGQPHTVLSRTPHTARGTEAALYSCTTATWEDPRSSGGYCLQKFSKLPPAPDEGQREKKGTWDLSWRRDTANNSSVRFRTAKRSVSFLRWCSNSVVLMANRGQQDKQPQFPPGWEEEHGPIHRVAFSQEELARKAKEFVPLIFTQFPDFLGAPGEPWDQPWDPRTTILERRLQEELQPQRQRNGHCTFCYQNGEVVIKENGGEDPASFYKTHVLKDSQGRTQCPVLRQHVCPNCKATGDMAHTISHCPLADKK